MDDDEEKAEERLIELQLQLSEAVNHLARIHCIRQRIKNKGKELFQRGMEELDKEDDVAPALNAHKHWVVDDLQSIGMPNEPDWLEFSLGKVDLSLLLVGGPSSS